MLDQQLPAGADGYELSVDRERGVVLRVAAAVEGEEFWVSEFEELAFDEDFPADTFRFVPPPGEEVRAPAVPFHEPFAIEEAEELASKDPLTGLLNRASFGQELEQAILRAAQQAPDEKPQPPTLILLDIDKLAAYNDAHGHLAGDEFLAQFAGVLQGTVRPTDFAGRIGGGEFALLVLGRSRSQLDGVLSRLRAKLPQPPTASMGAATWRRGESAPDLFNRADAALYDAKYPREN